MILKMLLAIQNTPPPTEDIKSILSWIIGVLITVIIGLVAYFKLEKKTLKEELKDERDFYKLQYAENIKAIINSTNIQERLVKLSEKGSEVVISITPIVQDTNVRIKELTQKINNGS